MEEVQAVVDRAANAALIMSYGAPVTVIDPCAPAANSNRLLFQ